MLTNNFFRASFGILAVMLMTPLYANMLQGFEIVPPKYDIESRLGVNMAACVPEVSLMDVSIGGELGLSHIISSLNGRFVNAQRSVVLNGNGSTYNKYLGASDSYFGGVYFDSKTIHVRTPTGSLQHTSLSIAKVSDGSNSYEFTLSGSPPTFSPLNRNKSLSLKYIEGEGFQLRRHDGALVKYPTDLSLTSMSVDEYSRMRINGVAMSEIEYKNGFKVYIHKDDDYGSTPIRSVTTNTGYQLYYDYDIHSQPLSIAKQSILNDYNTNSPLKLPQGESSLWSSLAPRRIIAINNEYEYCDPFSYTCSLTEDWPTATHYWENGMPVAAYLGNSEFKIVDAAGRETSILHAVNSQSLSSYGKAYPPRITKITYPDGKEVTYSYEVYNGNERVNGAITNSGEHVTYDGSFTTGENALLCSSDEYKGVNKTIQNSLIGVPTSIESWNRVIELEDTFENKVLSVVDKIGGYVTSFEYDDRHNITARIEWGNDGINDGTFLRRTAEYEASCTSVNYKYCNSPNWVKDARGKQIDYVYDEHQQGHGMISSITYPADFFGQRKQVRFEYDTFSATFINPITGMNEPADPIWLLTVRRECSNAFVYTGSLECTTSEEVVTEYEYELGNLQLIGELVTSKNPITGVSESLRTCYRYDKYGNKIGETRPKASFSSCAY